MTIVDFTTATASGTDLQAEVAHRLGRHEGHHPVGAALQFHLRHHRVGEDLRDQPHEPIARAALHPGWIIGRYGDGLGTRGQVRAIDDEMPAVVFARRQGIRGHPAPHGVVADPEETSRLTNPILRHRLDVITAFAEPLDLVAPALPGPLGVLPLDGVHQAVLGHR